MVERQERLPARDEVDEVAPGIGRIQLPIMIPGLGHVNCYVLEDERGVALVDPGMPDPWTHQVLIERLRSIDIAPEHIHTVLVTHSHPDHFGGAGRLRVEHRCEVVAHRRFHTPFDPSPDPFADDLTELTVATDPLEPGGDDDRPRNERLAEVPLRRGPMPQVPRPTPWGERGPSPAPESSGDAGLGRPVQQGLLRLDPTVRVGDLRCCAWAAAVAGRAHPRHTGDPLPRPGSTARSRPATTLPTITPTSPGMTGDDDPLAGSSPRHVAALDVSDQVLPARTALRRPRRLLDDIISHHVAHRPSSNGWARSWATPPSGTTPAGCSRSGRGARWPSQETYAHLLHLQHEGPDGGPPMRTPGCATAPSLPDARPRSGQIQADPGRSRPDPTDLRKFSLTAPEAVVRSTPSRYGRISSAPAANDTELQPEQTR
ncbi:MAG: MBL fold metallo-hydrolase [Microthrixaceae bacterium]|nr:MBL fold metallo-hydrolase [Microthrixaceae bacterium]